MDPTALRGDGARIAFWINTYNERLRGFLADRPRSGHLFRHRSLFRRESFEFGELDYWAEPRATGSAGTRAS